MINELLVEVMCKNGSKNYIIIHTSSILLAYAVSIFLSNAVGQELTTTVELNKLQGRALPAMDSLLKPKNILIYY